MLEAALRLAQPRCFAILLFGLVLASPVMAQPSNTCDGSESLDGSDVLPQMLNLGAGTMTDTFTMTGTDCTDVAGDDMVVCLTPENSCTVDISCFYTPSGGGTTATNVFEGACTTSPASCLSSTVGAGTQTIAGVSLTAGTQVCVVCSNSVGATSLDVSIAVNTGDCGALPVELESFSIASEEPSDPPPAATR